MPTSSYWRVYLPVDTTAHYQDVRLLRDFTKKASGYRWHYKSKRFRDEGFSTASPLNFSHDDAIVGAGSLLLQMKVDKHDLSKELVTLLAKSDLLKIDFKAPSAKKNRRALETLDLSKGKKMIVDVAMVVLGGHAVEKSMYLEMYKMTLAPRMKVLNNRAVKEKKYLL